MNEVKEKITINHEEIKEWVNAHNGTPQLIDEIDAKGDIVGIRIDLPGTKDDMTIDKEKYRKATWDDFFLRFEEMGLAFVYYDDKEKFDDPNRSYRFQPRKLTDWA